jgi:protein-S-isoprenylcysteine O-methyltransferase Ste14
MNKTLVLLYGNINYHIGNLAFICLVAFTLNLIPANKYVTIGIDAGEVSNIFYSIIINISLISLFGLQHSIMARPKFKQWLTRFLPEAAERSTFVLATAIVVFLLCIFWQPMPTVIWQAENTYIYYTLLGISFFGWALVVYSTFLVNHFDLHGLRQVWLYFKDKEYTQLPFTLNSLYKHIRHPIMTGFFIGIWFTPVMTVGHLLFAIGLSVYILIGVYHEERDLLVTFGDQYKQYIKKSAKFFPFF